MQERSDSYIHING